MKQMFLDVETTGLTPEHGITQIAGEIVINGETVKKFDLRPKLFSGDKIAVESLEITGMTRAEIEKGEPPTQVFDKLIKIMSQHVDRFNKLDKFQLIGYNVRFDLDMLRSFFEKNSNRYMGSWFWFPPTDVMNMAAVALAGRRHMMPDFKLKTVAAELGLDVKESSLHEADYDIELTKQIYNLLVARQEKASLYNLLEEKYKYALRALVTCGDMGKVSDCEECPVNRATVDYVCSAEGNVAHVCMKALDMFIMEKVTPF